jgi:hypothetical protein
MRIDSLKALHFFHIQQRQCFAAYIFQRFPKTTLTCRGFLLNVRAYPSLA